MNVQIDGQMDRQISGRTDRWTDGSADGQTDQQMDDRLVEQMDGKTDGQDNIYCKAKMKDEWGPDDLIYKLDMVFDWSS